MIMRKFREAYREALDNSIRYTTCCQKIQDEAGHKERVGRQRRKKAVSAAAGFLVLLICGFTTVKAADYICNRISITGFGFKSSAGTAEGVQEQFALGEEAGFLENWTEVTKKGVKADKVVIEEIEERTYTSYEAFKNKRHFLW